MTDDVYFSGDTYEPDNDHDRLKAQLWRVKRLMRDGEWRTLFEIRDVTGDPTQSVSARLRDFRKERFGEHTVNRRRRGEGRKGLFEYQLILNSRRENNHDTDQKNKPPKSKKRAVGQLATEKKQLDLDLRPQRGNPL